MLNAVNYLIGDYDLMKLRGRKLKLRLLDRGKVVKEQANWKIINVVFPPAIVIILGLLFSYFRHRKYTRA